MDKLAQVGNGEEEERNLQKIESQLYERLSN